MTSRRSRARHINVNVEIKLTDKSVVLESSRYALYWFCCYFCCITRQRHGTKNYVVISSPVSELQTQTRNPTHPTILAHFDAWPITRWPIINPDSRLLAVWRRFLNERLKIAKKLIAVSRYLESWNVLSNKRKIFAKTRTQRWKYQFFIFLFWSIS